MKKTLKIFAWLILLVVVAVIGRYAYLYFWGDKTRQSALSLVSENAVFVVQTSDIGRAWTQISDSKVWMFLVQNPYFSDIDESFEMLNKYLKRNKIADFILKDRDLTMSAHMISGKEWDFLFVVDLAKASFLKNDLREALGLVDGYNLTETAYKGQKIIELTDVADPKSSIYMANADNLLLVCFSGSLLEKTLDNYLNKQRPENIAFTEVTESLGSKKLFRFWFNYSQLNNFSKVYVEEESETLKMLGNSLKYSAFDINLEDELLSFDGTTNLDTAASYMKALVQVSPGKMRAFEIVSDRAAMYLSIGFEDFGELFEKLTEQYKADNSGDLEDIEGNVALLEKYLGISLKEHFMQHIGNEIALVKLRPGINTRPEDVVALVHSKDMQKTIDGWNLITERIGKRTIVKFKTENYKNFDIRILERRGFFKLFFGKLFNKLEKPYFTYIEDFVVFSNSLENLKTFIDDYVTGNTLSHKKEFVDFKDNFDSKSNLTIFIQTPKIYENLYFYSTTEDRKSLHENKDFILGFALFGFQLVSQDKSFKTKFMAFHDPHATAADELEKIEKETSEDLYKDSIENLSFKIMLPPDSLEKQGLYREYFPETQTVRIEGHIYDNQLSGIWRSYYPSGNLQSTINYLDSKIEGEAMFYRDSPQKILRAQAKFIQDQVVETYYEFYENGTQKAKISYEDGIAHGDAEFYYPDGRKKIEASYKKGQKSGRWKYFDTDGNLISKEKWKKGEKK